jgi:hypothetical protein
VQFYRPTRREKRGGDASGICVIAVAAYKLCERHWLGHGHGCQILDVTGKSEQEDGRGDEGSEADDSDDTWQRGTRKHPSLKISDAIRFEGAQPFEYAAAINGS